MALFVWVYFFDQVPANTRASVSALLQRSGIETHPMPDFPQGVGLVFFQEVNAGVIEWIRAASHGAEVLAIGVGPTAPDASDSWALLDAGAADVLLWPHVPDRAEQVAARLHRWASVSALMHSPRVAGSLIGESKAWRSLVGQVVEVAAFTQASVLIVGESGTGKELLAGLVHDLDSRSRKRDLVIVDCTTITPELAGSELFGHERGAFTGAINARDGACALADGGTLFLDEIGELPLPLQAQLLRVIQEREFKRVGGNTWQHTDFRLVCATNKDLQAAVAGGSFRSDLYYRIAAWVCRTPPLRDRREDILPLSAHFIKRLAANDSVPELDAAVTSYLSTRDYPGNVRDLLQLVTRIWHRHTGPGPITIGAVPVLDRPATPLEPASWRDEGFETALRRAVDLRVGVKEISRAAAETAIWCAVEQESGNLQRAARRLGVTDRALQLRRASRRRPLGT